MRNPHLKLMDLVLGLERFGARYDAIDVLADDVLEARSAEPVAGLSVTDEGQRFHFIGREGAPYSVDVLPEEGLVRMSRAPGTMPSEQHATVGLTGPTADRARGAAQRLRGEGAAEEHLILGLLVGAPPGRSKTVNARRVFTMQFDTTIGQWRPYSGGLVPWMKEHLLSKSA